MVYTLLLSPHLVTICDKTLRNYQKDEQENLR